MARKSHSKSRNGCLECKKRRTKCDEGKPKCATCRRLGQQCTYQDLASGPISRPSTRAPSPISSVTTPCNATTPAVDGFLQQVSQSSPLASAPLEPLAMEDLRLLHHFVTSTYATLDTTNEARENWRLKFPKIGFSYPFVLRGILSVAALHLGTLEPESGDEYLVTASNQYNLALPGFRSMLADVSSENCSAVFIFSCVTVIHTLAVAQIQRPEDPIADLQRTLQLVRSTLGVLDPHWKTIEAKAGHPATNRENLLGPLQSQNQANSIPEILELRAFAASHPNQKIAEEYTHAIDMLHTVIYRVWKSDESEFYLAFILSWPAMLNDQFFEALSKKEPISLVIIAYFAASLGYKADCWWIRSWNTLIMAAVIEELEPDMMGWLEWPKRVVATSLPTRLIGINEAVSPVKN